MYLFYFEKKTVCCFFLIQIFERIVCAFLGENEHISLETIAVVVN